MEVSEEEQTKKPRFDMLTLFLGAAGVVGLLFAFVFYRSNFGSEISHASTEWSNFGSYFGGLLNPFVSLLMLIAVLRTILLQREMLTQQDRMLAQQSAQTAQLQADSERAKIHTHKSTLLQLAGNIRDSHTREIDASRLMCADSIRNMISSNDAQIIKNNAEGVEKLNEQIGVLSRRRSAVEMAMFDMAVKDYGSIEDLDLDFRDKFSGRN